MKTYHIYYKIHQFSNEVGIDVIAQSKETAYDKAIYEVIPQKEGCSPYSAWVSSVTYSNGNWKQFNTFEGKPY